MIDHCAKHGSYATFCRDCDYDVPSRAVQLLVTGGRAYPHPGFVWSALDDILAVTPIATLIHGACPTGADLFAAQWAGRRGVTPDPHPAPWDDIDAPGAKIRMNRAGKPYNVLAGFQRNQTLVDRLYAGDVAVAFAGSRGTDDCVARILRAIRGGLEIDFRDLRGARVLSHA